MSNDPTCRTSLALSSQPTQRRKRATLLGMMLSLILGILWCWLIPLPAQADLGTDVVFVGAETATTQSIAWGDWDGDGDLDLAVGNYGEGTQVYQNDGDHFSLAWESTGDNKNTTSVAWGDWDGDGDLDLAVGNSWNTNQVYQNDGYSFSLVWESTGDEKNTTSVAWGDWDGDGDLDLAFGNGCGGIPFVCHASQIYENDNENLGLTWQSTGDDKDTRSVAWGDWDGDGDLDLAFGNAPREDRGIGGQNQVYLNDEGSLTLAWESTGDEKSTQSIEWGDWDGDGDLDLAVGNDQESNQVYRNDGGSLSLAWESTGDERNTTSVTWGDWDGDGDLDLAVGNDQESNQVYRNDGGSLGLAWESTGDERSTTSVAWGDWDADGDLDLAAGNDDAVNLVYQNDGTELGKAWESTGDAAWSWSIAWGDWDGDGDLDLAVGNSGVNQVYQKDRGNLSLAWESTGDEKETRSVAWGDWDGDGDLDLAVGNYGVNQVYQNDGGNLSLAWESTGDGKWTESVAWGDWDGDGDLDLAVGNGCIGYPSICQPNQVYQNDGGNLGLAWESTGDEKYTWSVAWGDWDEDGDLDLAVGNSESGVPYGEVNQVYRNDGGSLSLAWESTGDEKYTYSVAWGDWDGDGDLDLAVGNNTTNQVYQNDGGNLSLAWESAGDEKYTWSVAWGDWDGDNDLDLGVGNHGVNQVYQNDGGNLSLAWESTGDESHTYGVAWMDWDGDGDLDLSCANDGVNRIYQNLRLGGSRPANGPPSAFAHRPGATDDAFFFSTPQVLEAPILPISYILFDPELDPISRVTGYYSLNGGGKWLPAVATTDTVTTNVATGHLARTKAAVPIPDDGSLTSMLTINDTGQIYNLELTLSINHTQNSQLAASLWAPWPTPKGTSILLFDGVGGTGDGFQSLTLSEQATRSITTMVGIDAPVNGAYRPIESLALFQGAPLDTPFRLVITDTVGGEEGSLEWWTLRSAGREYIFEWDTFASGLFGQSDNVIFRLDVTGPVGPFQTAKTTVNSPPFRVRGTQVRVYSETATSGNEVAGALVYRLPAGQYTGAEPIADFAGRPFRTDHLGYLRGHGEIHVGDRLLAMLPITWTESYTLYHTSGVPTEVGLDAFSVLTPGVQVLTVTAAHPLLLFDLHVSVEWDATNDPNNYLGQLATDLKQTSRYLYDFTNGQVALGRVVVYQNADDWAFSHVVVHTTNRLRPFAAQGGMVITTTVDPQHNDIIYEVGQLHMGATWNRYGTPGQNLGLDWPLILAHELGHYLLFLDDVYLGLNEDGLLIPVDMCTGSAMGDVYDPDNTEFIAAVNHWNTNCADTLTNRTLERTEWETIQLWYPWLITPTVVNPGPSRMPFDLTTVTILKPITPTNGLEDATFYLDYANQEVSSSEARAFLLPEDDYVIDLGSPVGGQNRVLARGAQPGDRLCVFDQPRRQYGCEAVENGDERVQLEKDETWTPMIQLSPVNSTTFGIQIDAVPPGLTLQARLYPEYGSGSDTVTLTFVHGIYSGTFNLLHPALTGHVQAWVDETATEANPRREAIVAYAIGGNPGVIRGAGGVIRGAGGVIRGAGGVIRGAGGVIRGAGGVIRGAGAPLVSPNGQMTFFTENPIIFNEGEFYTVQNMAGSPPLPAGKTAIGQAYNLVASPNVTRMITGSVSIQYMETDTLIEGVDEDELTIHHWDRGGWHTLDTVRDTTYNLASAPSQGSGVYALLAGVTHPVVTNVAPSAATNDVTTTLNISGGDFLPPVEVALVGANATYTLSLLSVSPYTITAVVTQGLPAGEYQVIAVNRNQPGGPAASPMPGTFALYDPANACFYDFFESGAGKWQMDGEWDVVVLPSGEGAMTDSPMGPYKSAGDYDSEAITYTTHVTSQAFDLSQCVNPMLTVRHDYVIVQAGSSQDTGEVEISTDDGATWTRLASYSGGGVPGGPNPKAEGADSAEWADVNWRNVKVDLSVYTGTVRLRFGLTVDRYLSDKGWVIDDVMVKSAFPPTFVFLPAVLKEG